MILGVGTDLVRIERLERAIGRFPERFTQRIFTPAEQRLCEGGGMRFACYAKRFAAKEALVKALGVGMRDGVWFTDVEVLNDALGKPLVTLTGKSAQFLQNILHREQLSRAVIHLSLADEEGFALAHLILEGR
ncbi:MAG: holo-ACP synthase [Magnetococcales bacterium]|nr:holo-ACP synthase [Magnetococcales bacterium]